MLVTTLQAVSGPGYPGVPSFDIIGNVIPGIGGEEDKIETEPNKILGPLRRRARRIAPGRDQRAYDAGARDRRPHHDGLDRLRAQAFRRSTWPTRMRAWRGRPQELRLPSAPPDPIEVEDHGFRPQPRLDVDRGGGMTVTVGRIRKCPLLGTKFVAMGHNTVRGAAGAAVLNAELMLADGWLGGD